MISLTANHRFCSFPHLLIFAGMFPRQPQRLRGKHTRKISRWGKLTTSVRPAGPLYSGLKRSPSMLLDLTSKVWRGRMRPREVGMGPVYALKNEM